MNNDTRHDDGDRGTWIVMCEVSGGVTGTRTGTLKSNGETRIFATREEAAEEVERQTSTVRLGSAMYYYWVEANVGRR